MRLFVAIELPEAIKDQLLSVCAGLHGAKWVDPAQMHLTLRFLGEVDRPHADDIADALGQVYAPRFDIALAGLGEFSARGRPSVLWAGICPSAELAALQSKIESAARRAGVAPERRKFHPHVTLARFERGAGTPQLGRYIADHEPFAAGPFLAEEFVLFSSVLGSAGATHIAEATYPLRYARESAAE
jgi:RNA 2',3'-cyclic 3'-phosphodiesterase